MILCTPPRSLCLCLEMIVLTSSLLRPLFSAQVCFKCLLDAFLLTVVFFSLFSSFPPGPIRQMQYDVCASVTEDWLNPTTLTLNCINGGIITFIPFVSYGTPNGACGSEVIGGCDSSSAVCASLFHFLFNLSSSSAILMNIQQLTHLYREILCRTHA